MNQRLLDDGVDVDINRRLLQSAGVNSGYSSVSTGRAYLLLAGRGDAEVGEEGDLGDRAEL
jgi:hypothetical protein